MPREPVVVVLVCSGLAALMTAFGALPFVDSRKKRPRLIGLAEAAAAGLMLGAAYLLMLRALDRGTIWAIVGAGLGVGYTLSIQWYADVQEIDGDRESPIFGYKLLLQNFLHSASEGVAIGVAMVLELRLGIFVAFALGVHNIAEGVALSGVLRDRGMKARQAAGVCVAAKSSQPLFALAIFALEPVLGGGWLTPMLGLAAGSLAFLVLTELLPDAYDKTPDEWVASVTTAAAAVVILLEEFLV